MARPREFDEEQVLERAMLCFWEHGYESTSVRDLIQAMQISSSSMYEFLGDKHSIFLKVLARYCQIEQARIREMAFQAPTPQQFIESLFASVSFVNESRVGQGSFTFRVMVELGTRDADVTRQLLSHYFEIAQIITEILERAQQTRAIAYQIPPDELAHTLLSTLHGIATITRVKPDFAYRGAVTKALLSFINNS